MTVAVDEGLDVIIGDGTVRVASDGCLLDELSAITHAEPKKSVRIEMIAMSPIFALLLDIRLKQSHPRSMPMVNGSKAIATLKTIRYPTNSINFFTK